MSGVLFCLTPFEWLVHWEDHILPLVPRKPTKGELIDDFFAENTGKLTTNHAELMKKDEKAIKKISKKPKILFS